MNSTSLGRRIDRARRAAGTQSLVFAIGTSGGVHPVTTYSALNYDLSKHAPITLDTLFRPGTQPMAVLNPIVQPELDRHGATGSLTLEDLGAKAYQNFAITDDAVHLLLQPRRPASARKRSAHSGSASHRNRFTTCLTTPELHRQGTRTWRKLHVADVLKSALDRNGDHRGDILARRMLDEYAGADHGRCRQAGGDQRWSRGRPEPAAAR